MFKHKKDKSRVLFLHPLALVIMFDMKFFCSENYIPFTVTSTMSTIEEDKKLSRKSSTHRTGRAFDLSIKGWSNLEIKDFIAHFNKKYEHVAAYTKSTNKNTLIIHHNSGHGDHLHVQINYKYKLKELTLEDFSEK